MANIGHRLHHKKTIIRSTSAQIQVLIEYMANHKDLANSGGQYGGVMGQIKANEEWEALREMLRGYGGDKSVGQWRQTWRDLKRKARNILKESKQGQIPIVTDMIYKILDTISPPGEECIVQIKDSSTSVAIEDIDWAMDNDSIMLDNEPEGDETKNSHNNDGSSEGEDEEIKDSASLVQVLVPVPQAKEDQDTSSKKPQNDPLQAPVVGIPRPPRLTAKPRRSPPASRSRSPPSPPAARRRLRTPMRDKRAPSIDARRRQMLISRRRKQQDMIHQASNDFVALEHSRLKMEEERDRRLHEREMERLKLELQRIEVQRNHNELLQHVVNIAQSAYELLQRNLQ